MDSILECRNMRKLSQLQLNNGMKQNSLDDDDKVGHVVFRRQQGWAQRMTVLDSMTTEHGVSKFPYNDLLIVVDTVSATDMGNTPYLSSKLPRTEDSHNENGIIDLDAFESSHTGISIRVGSIFRKKSVLKKAIYMCALNNSFELVIDRSNRTSFDIRCKDSSCPWYLCASIHHGVNVSYDKAWRGHEIALNSIRGTPEDSYSRGLVHIQLKKQMMKVVDGAATKDKYLGTLIFACTIDGNSQIVPLAFAVVDSENNLS
uniref:Transposase MuDR plant domain-containing protein n=1 Tax=Cucumis melo TaxID=3656 RepID=A0A9I9ELC6_CUCME